MKKYFFIFFITLTNIVYSQQREIYCDVLASQLTPFSKVHIAIDFGESKWRESVVDENGKSMKFNSVIDALNYMAKNGWHLHSTMLLSEQNSSVYHYIMVKNIDVKDIIIKEKENIDNVQTTDNSIIAEITNKIYYYNKTMKMFDISSEEYNKLQNEKNKLTIQLDSLYKNLHN